MNTTLESTKTAPSPEQLAHKFAEILAGWLTKDEQEMIVRQNAKEANPSICHSHDFCDPNQAMIDALESFGIELDCQSDEQNALTADAWTIAKQNGFWFEPKREYVHNRTYGLNYNGSRVCVRWYLNSLTVGDLGAAIVAIEEEAKQLNVTLANAQVSVNPNGVFFQGRVTEEYCGCASAHKGTLAVELERKLETLNFKRSNSIF